MVKLGSNALRVHFNHSTVKTTYYGNNIVILINLSKINQWVHFNLSLFTDSVRILGDFQWIWAIFYFPQGSMEYGSYFLLPTSTIWTFESSWQFVHSKIALQHAKSFCRLCFVLLSYWPELASSLSYLLHVHEAWNTAVQFLLCVSSQGCGSEVDRRARGVQCGVGRLVQCKTAGYYSVVGGSGQSLWLPVEPSCLEK